MSGIQFVLFEVRSRVRPRLSQRALAKLIGVDHTTIWNWEHGESSRIDFDVLGRLCTVLSKKLGERVGPEHLLQRKKGRKSAAEREVRKLMEECTGARYALVEGLLSEAVEAAEREDVWTAILYAYAAAFGDDPKPLESPQQFARRAAALHEVQPAQ